MSVDLQPYASPDDSLASPIEASFPFLSLPIEIRLKIYRLLLPPRTHTIVTALPTNGLFYNTSLLPTISSRSSSPSFYPFGRVPPTNIASYKVLTSNFRTSYPEPSIYPEILRTSKQIRHEAEPVLYGGSGVEWDFGIHLEALKSFWKGRSPLARESAKHVRIAKEIPSIENQDGQVSKPVDDKWIELSSFLKTHLPGLRTVDLTIWSSSGLTSSFPPSSLLNQEEDRDAKQNQVAQWRDWEWTHDLLGLERLRRVEVKIWGFQNIRDETNFDSWLAGRMVGDRVVRQRMIGEGVVSEERVVLPGAC